MRPIWAQTSVRLTLCLGNSLIEAAIDWIIDHQNDEDIDEMPLVCLYILDLFSLILHVSVLGIHIKGLVIWFPVSYREFFLVFIRGYCFTHSCPKITLR